MRAQRSIGFAVMALFVMVAAAVFGRVATAPARRATAAPAAAARAGPAGGSREQSHSIALASFHADIEVQPDASALVTETLRVRFQGEWNGINRDISLQHMTAQGRRSRLRLSVLSVTDLDGRALRVETKHKLSRRSLKIWIPDARDATRTVIIRYRVANPLRFFRRASDPGGIHDELYWNITGNAWDMPIQQASARIRLPEGAHEVSAVAYTGPAGSQAHNARVVVQGREARITTRYPLQPLDGLTVSVSWPPGLVAQPGPATRAAGEAAYWWPGLLPLLALLLGGQAWSRKGRDPRSRPIVVQYEPPSDLTPGELGTLTDHEVDQEDLTATLVDLAVRGYLIIEEREEKRLLGLTHATAYYFHQRRPAADWATLRPHERKYLEALFQDQYTKAGREHLDKIGVAPPAGTLASVRLSDLKNSFYKNLKGIRDAIYDNLVACGYYGSRPDQVKANWTALAGAMLMLGVGAAAWISQDGLPLAGPWPLGVGAVLAAVILGVFSRIMPARTEQGARTREAALGFREFLDRVEAPRYKAVITSPALFERYLPFAMAFKVEDHWARAFEDLVRTPPDWYRGGSYSGSFHAGSFTSNLNAMSSHAASTMSSSPSGSGGGGSSGGGSGGGGGSGF